MARTVHDARLETRTARSRLAIRPKPYWRTIDPGVHLGYRKGTRGGRWLMRWYAGSGAYRETSIGTADDHAEPDGRQVLSFAQAQAAARQQAVVYAQQAQGIADPTTFTVADALQDYLEWMEHHRKSAHDARCRVNALILPALGHRKVIQLTATHIRQWLNDLVNTPAKHRAPATDPDAIRKRKATANRTLNLLKAALNRAWREGQVADDGAWRRVKPFPQVSAARLRWLTLEEAQRLVNASGPGLRELVQTALMTGCRFGELARLVTSDFNPESGLLRVAESKSGRSRHVVLTEEGATLMTRLTRGKARDEPLLNPRPGQSWTPNLYQRPLQRACENARIDPPISLHGLRHTYASLSVMAGMPLLVLATNLGHRDTRMVERHYGHLAPSYVHDAVRAHAPRFGSLLNENVVKLHSL